MNEQTKTIEALGYTWRFSANSVLAEVQRGQLILQARAFIDSLPKRSERMTALAFFAAYADVVSSLDSLEGETEALGKGEDLADSLFDPAKWLELAQYAYNQSEYYQLEELSAAANECNPQWHEESLLKDAPRDAQETLDQTEKALDPENNPNTEPPDVEAIQEAAEAVISHAEAEAKEAGKVGPQAFRRPRKK